MIRDHERDLYLARGAKDALKRYEAPSRSGRLRKPG